MCPVCIGWLARRAGILDVTPILAVLDMATSVSFYETAGFSVEVYQPGGAYAFVNYGDQCLFHLNLAERPANPATNGGCYVVVPDVDGWHARLAAAGLPVTELEDQPWGLREFALTDPAGNHLRICSLS